MQAAQERICKARELWYSAPQTRISSSRRAPPRRRWSCDEILTSSAFSQHRLTMCERRLTASTRGPNEPRHEASVRRPFSVTHGQQRSYRPDSDAVAHRIPIARQPARTSITVCQLAGRRGPDLSILDRLLAGRRSLPAPPPWRPHGRPLVKELRGPDQVAVVICTPSHGT